MLDFIQGDKFMAIANYTYAPSVRAFGDYCKLPNTLRVDQLKDGDMVYAHAFYAKQLFELLRGVTKKIVLITHNGDTRVDESFYPIPDCIIKWYAQNVAVVNPIIESIPIGLENDRWFPEVRKKEKMEAMWILPKEKKNLVYMNYAINTNPSQRTKPYELLKDKPWVTTNMGANGVGFDEYLNNIYNHRFMICPEGNGIDTHRTWECLYVGTIPIEKRNINNQFYTDLPIVFIDDWEEVTEERLSKENRFKGRDTNWNFHKLLFKYWRNKITMPL